MVYFFYGTNTYMAKQKIRSLIARFKEGDPSGFGLERYDATDMKAEDQGKLLSALTSLPFLGSHRLIIIDDLLTNAELAEAVMDQLDNIPDSTVVIIHERKVDERTKQLKVLKSLVKNYRFDPLDPIKLRQWVRKQAQDVGGAIDNPTAEFLIERVGNDQWRLSNEINKLVNFSPQVSTEIIQAMVEPHFEQTIFDLVEALAYGRTPQAIKLYAGLRSTKVQPLFILSMIGWQLRNLLVAISSKGRSPKDIVADHGISPYVVGKSLQASARLSLERLKKAHKLLVNTDHQLKTTAVDADIAVEQLLIGIGQQLS